MLINNIVGVLVISVCLGRDHLGFWVHGASGMSPAERSYLSVQSHILYHNTCTCPRGDYEIECMCACNCGLKYNFHRTKLHALYVFHLFNS